MKIEKMHIKVDSCPFCGGEAHLVRHVNNLISRDAFYSVTCDVCGADVYFFGQENSALRTKKAWDTRASYD